MKKSNLKKIEIDPIINFKSNKTVNYNQNINDFNEINNPLELIKKYCLIFTMKNFQIKNNKDNILSLFNFIKIHFFNILILEQIIYNSLNDETRKSYTKKILNNKELLFIKILEEANEVWCASNNNNKNNLIYELSDLIYFMTTLCVSNNIKMNMIFNKIINNYNSFQLNLINNLNKKTLKIGLCLTKSISYQKKIFDFLKLNGINIEIKNNNKINFQFLNQTNINIKSFLIKPKDVYRFIEKNLLDVVFCFQDILENFPCNYKKINCNYESSNIIITKICVIAQNNFNLEIYKKNKLKKLVIFSEYNYLTSKWVEDNNLTAKIISVNGGNEGYLISNLCDLIVSVCSTGETLRANNLKILEVIYESKFGIYAKPEFQEEIQNIININK